MTRPLTIGSTPDLKNATQQATPISAYTGPLRIPRRERTP